jgi:nascent polypeptide-associated complex subunit beta
VKNKIDHINMSKKQATKPAATTAAATKQQPKKDYDAEKAKTKYKHEVNQEKIEQLKKAAAALKTGGVVKKKKIVSRKASTQTDAKVQNLLKRFNLQPLPDVNNVLFFMENQSVLQFSSPKVQAGYQTGVFVVSGKYEETTIDKVVPKFDNMDIQQIQQMLQQVQAQKQQTKEDIPNVDTFENVQ